MNPVLSFAGKPDNVAWRNSSRPVSEFARLKNRLIATPVQLSVGTDIKERFEKAPDGEARIQLLPKTEDAWNRLKTEALQSDHPLRNLAEAAEQWLFPSVNHARNQFALIPNIQQPADSRPLSEVGVTNSQNVLNSYERALEQLDAEQVRRARVEIPTDGYMPPAVSAGELGREMAMSAAQHGYNYRFHRADFQPAKSLQSIELSLPGIQPEHVELGKALGQAMLLTRHLVDAPANVCTTGYFTARAKEMVNKAATLSLNVLDENALRGNHPKNAKKMGLLLAVGQGNTYDNFRDYRDRQPRLLEVVHTPPNWNPKTGRTVLVVGKGIIFDTGGNNLKSSLYMHNMRGDMAGAAAVLGLMQTLDAKPLDNIRVVGLMPLTENRISGKAMLPQNLYTSRSGKTVEIKNTDAEGRLVLADAMNYGLEKYTAGQQTVDAVFDIATLTGGKVRAIGEQNAVGLAGNNADLLEAANGVLKNGLRRKTDTLLLNDQYRKAVTEEYGVGGQADAINSCGVTGYIRAGLIKEGVTDPEKAIEQYEKNASSFQNNPKFMKEAGFSQFGDGAAFIQAVGLDSIRKNSKGNMVGENKPNIPWLHFDIAGAEFSKPDPRRGGREWATGIGVPDLYLTLQGIASGKIMLDPQKTKAQ
ncbi:MAG: leucyl aminopeptidase [Vampirovibrio sp.]|jgi:leucyl aminopeptidase|nr:leucyl aminopeptidase [Vampirovibrio sp.]